MIQEWDITRTNLFRARRRKYQVAVLPVGAIEAHNLHLPAGTDFLTANEVARRACAAAWDRCRSVLCLPALPYGVDANLLAYPPTVHVRHGVLEEMIRQIVSSLRRHGLRKFVLLNGHGGNEFMPLIRQAQHDMDVHVFSIDWWKVGHDRYAEFFTRPDDHAGQMETSVALALFPELVELERATNGQAREMRFAACRDGWARTSRDFARMSDDCCSGDPAGASAQRGRAYLELCVGRIADFLVELARAKVDRRFPFVAGPETEAAQARAPKRRTLRRGR